MQLFKHTKPHVLIADEGKQLKEVMEVDAIDGEEQEPVITYFTVAFVPDSTTIEDCQSKYAEVDLEE